MPCHLGAAAAAFLLLAGGGAGQAAVLRCSNDTSTRAIADEAAALFVLNAQAVNHDAEHPIDPAQVSVKLSDTYETDRSEFVKACHGHLAISYEGATPGAEIDYQVIETDDGRVITKWPHDPQLGQALVMQLILARALAEQAAKNPNATPEEAARALLTPEQGPGSVAAANREYAKQHPDMNSGGYRSPPLTGGTGPVQRHDR